MNIKYIVVQAEKHERKQKNINAVTQIKIGTIIKVFYAMKKDNELITLLLKTETLLVT